MKLFRSPVPPRMLFVFGFMAGCGRGNSPGPVEDSAAVTGSIEVALSSVPADVACVRISVSGSREASQWVQGAPGKAATFNMGRLPLGLAQVGAQAFSETCSSVASDSVPAWVTQSPVSVRIDAKNVVQVLLKLIRNGRLSVGLDSEASPWVTRSSAPINVAIFGDLPYGASQIADYPNFLASVNADPSLTVAVHLGDIKNGGSRCDTAYFQFVLDGLNTLNASVFYTPGDNEWTDCHRASNGAYDPMERLSVLRRMYYPTPGLSLGVAQRQVLSQATFPGFETYVENQLWVDAGTVFALVHVVGSNNNLLPWFGDDKTGAKRDDPARRTAEVAAREAANQAWLDHVFSVAQEEDVQTVVIMMQADMWEGAATDGFSATIQKIAAKTLDFGKPVLLLQGDSHLFNVDNPLATGDLAHGVSTPVPNLTRVVVQGSNIFPRSEYLRLHVDPKATPPFSWTRVPH